MGDQTTDPATATASSDVEQQITFNIKSSSDSKYVLTLPAATTIAELKQKLSTSEYAALPPERQRLIYSGRVLKDHDTLAGCKVKDGNTIHLVRGAESNQRQSPANQGGAAAVPPGAGQPASNIPFNMAAGGTATNPLAQLTGARYAGFHGLPGMDMFGADGGMGAPPNPDQILRMLDDPNFAQQMNEAMNNPAVLSMMRENPMIRDNPMARAAIDNPELRRMMFNPEMIRMQLQMQRALGGDGQGAFPMPGATDTTPAPAEGAATGGGTRATPNQTNTTGTAAQTPANPFASLFAGAPAAGTQGQQTADGAAGLQNPYGSLFGAAGAGAAAPNAPMAEMAQRMMQNPQLMQQMMQMMGGGGDATGAAAAGFNPFAGFGGLQAPETQPQDDRPPEVRYEPQLRQLNDMGFYDFDRNVQALRRSGGSVQGAVEFLLNNPSS